MTKLLRFEAFWQHLGKNKLKWLLVLISNRYILCVIVEIVNYVYVLWLCNFESKVSLRLLQNIKMIVIYTNTYTDTIFINCKMGDPNHLRLYSNINYWKAICNPDFNIAKKGLEAHGNSINNGMSSRFIP